MPARKVSGMKIDGGYEIQEIAINGDWAYLRNHISMSMTQPGQDAPVRRSGYTLTVLRKEADGQWRLARDANLLAAEKKLIVHEQAMQTLSSRMRDIDNYFNKMQTGQSR